MDGTYNVVALLGGGWTQTAPAAPVQVTLGWGEVASGVDMGLHNPALGIWRLGTVQVSVYDVDGPIDVDVNDIQVVITLAGDIAGITIGGTQRMQGLGIAVWGAGYVNAIKDARKGSVGDIAFIASNAPIKSLQTNAALVGYDLNGESMGGFDFADDIDGDGDTDDRTALYCEGDVQTIKLVKDVTGDFWIGGADSKGVAVKSFSNKTGGFHADLYAMGNVGKFALGGHFGSSIYIDGHLKSFQSKGGNLGGELHVTRTLGKFALKGVKNKQTGLLQGGSVTEDGAIIVDGWDSKGISAKSIGVAGDFLGALTTARGVSKFGIKGGDYGGQTTIGTSLKGFQVKGGKTAGGRFLKGALVSVAGALSKASFGSYGPDTDNGGDAYGLFAGSFGSCAFGATKLTGADLPYVDGDFRVEVV